MKKTILLLCLAVAGLVPMQRAFAQSAEVQQLMLNVEKLAQFKQILKDMKKGYEILNSGYSTIKDISQGNFSLHKTFLDGLMQVSPTVRNYRKVAQIIDYQLTLVREYKAASDRFRSDGNFNAGELDYLANIYGALESQSLRNLDELLMVVTAGQARMSDDERLETIDRIYADMQDKLQFLRSFNKSTSVLSLQRAKERNDARTVQKTLGINE